MFDGERYLVSATARPADVWDGAWHRVTGTFDGAALRIYVDGRPVGDPMPAPLRIDYDATSSRAQIGQYGGDCDLAFAGDLDEVSPVGERAERRRGGRAPSRQAQPPGGAAAGRAGRAAARGRAGRDHPRSAGADAAREQRPDAAARCAPPGPASWPAAASW